MILENSRSTKENNDCRIWTGIQTCNETLDGGRIGVAAQGLGIAEVHLRLPKNI